MHPTLWALQLNHVEKSKVLEIRRRRTANLGRMLVKKGHWRKEISRGIRESANYLPRTLPGTRASFGKPAKKARRPVVFWAEGTRQWSASREFRPRWPLYWTTVIHSEMHRTLKDKGHTGKGERAQRDGVRSHRNQSLDASPREKRGSDCWGGC